MWVRRIIGVVLVVVGAVWFAQGINLLGGSPMTGNPFWAFVGLPMVVFGIMLLRPLGRSRREHLGE
jgi:glucose dehydrogenase